MEISAQTGSVLSGNQQPAALVIGIIGRGHMEYGFGTPDQLDDLGIEEVGVLLTEYAGEKFEKVSQSDIADAVFRLQG